MELLNIPAYAWNWSTDTIATVSSMIFTGLSDALILFAEVSKKMGEALQVDLFSTHPEPTVPEKVTEQKDLPER